MPGSPLPIPFLQLVGLILLGLVSFKMLFSKKWDPKGKTCYVTGGSQGMGLALAIQLAQKGANVSIVARNVDKLKAAVATLETHRQSKDQVFRWHSFSLSTAKESAAAVDAECKANGGQAPDAFFLCAGNSRPGFWVEDTEEQLVQAMEQAYWVQAWTAHAASKVLVQQNRPGKICFVASTLAVMSIVGWSSYSPGKYALKGLAESLRSELLLYNIDVHIFFPPTMKTAGYAEEMKTKPAITAKIEEADDSITSEKAASLTLGAVINGKFQTSGNLITAIFLSSSRGSSPTSGGLGVYLLDQLAWIIVPIWRRMTDSTIRTHRPEHLEYLKERGVLSK